MNKEIVKKGFDLAQKESEEKQIQEVKEIVKSTLKKIRDIESKIDDKKLEIKELEDQKRILKLDIEDLKEGRLDRIEERQKADIKAKKVSVVVIEKIVEVHNHYDRWYEPYRTTWTIPVSPTAIPQLPIIYSTTSSGSSFSGSTINCSLAKNNTIGTYTVNNDVIHLR